MLWANGEERKSHECFWMSRAIPEEFPVWYI
jgi:hypothetical protein